MTENQDIKERKLVDIVSELYNKKRKEFYSLNNELNSLEISEELKSNLKMRIGLTSYNKNISNITYTAYGGIMSAYDALLFGLGKEYFEEALEIAEKGWDKHLGYGSFGGIAGYRELYPEIAFEFDKEFLRNLFSKFPKENLNGLKYSFLEMYIYPDYVQHVNSGNRKERRKQREEFETIRLERKNFLDNLDVKEPSLPQYKSRKDYIKLYWND